MAEKIDIEKTVVHLLAEMKTMKIAIEALRKEIEELKEKINS